MELFSLHLNISVPHIKEAGLLKKISEEHRTSEKEAIDESNRIK